MTKFMMMAATAGLVLAGATSSASANQCIPEGGNGRLICPFLYFATGESHFVVSQTTTTTIKKPKIHFGKHGFKKGFGFKKVGFGKNGFGKPSFKGAFGKNSFGKFGGPKFGGPKFGASKFGAPKFGGSKFGGMKFGGSKFGGSKFAGGKFGGFSKGSFGPKKFSMPKGGYGKGGYGKHGFGKHGKTVSKTEHYQGPGKKGPGPLASYALGATWCSAGSLVLNAMIVNATENRELTRSEAWQTTAGCWVPILGPLLVDAYFKANPQWAQ